MATEIKAWEIINGELNQIHSTLAANNRKEKEHLEQWIKSKPEILGNDIIIIGEQVPTKSGPLDFLAIDNKGNIIIVELKRDRLARKVLAQAIDYASDVSSWNVDKLSEICNSFTGFSLVDYLSSNFESIDIDDLVINQSQILLLVGFSIDEPLSRMIEWLSSNFDMSINAIILNYVNTSNGSEILSRTVTIPEEIAKQKTNKLKFKISMSNEPGTYEIDELRNLLIKYFSYNTVTTNRIKNILLPALLKNKLFSRAQLKSEFVKTNEAADESQAGYFIPAISTQLGIAYNDFLRQVIKYEYPNYEWEKDNFSLNDEYRDLIIEILEMNS